MRAKSHTRELETEEVLAHSLNPFSLDCSVHFFSPVLFLSFHHTVFLSLFIVKEGKNENKN